MPGPITEEQALQALSFGQAETDPDKRQRLGAVLADYRDQQEAKGEALYPKLEASKREESNRVRSLYTDRERHGLEDDKFKTLAQEYVNDDEGKYSFLNNQFIAHSTGKTTDEIRPLRGQYLDEYSTKTWGVPFTNEKEFFDKLGADFDVEDQANDWAQTAALKGLDNLQAYSQMPEELKNNPAYKAREFDFRIQYEETLRNTKDRIAPYQQLIAGAVESLQIKTGVKEGETNESFRDLAEGLLAVPDRDRGLVIAGIIAQGEKAEPKEEGAEGSRGVGQDAAELLLGKVGSKSTGQKLAENFGRGLVGLGVDSTSSVARQGLMSASQRVATLESIPIGSMLLDYAIEQESLTFDTSGGAAIAGAIEAGRAEMRPVTQEERDAAGAEIDKMLKGIDTSQELRQIAENNIDPAKGEWKVTTGIYQATRSLPYTLSSIAGPAGFMITAQALSEQSYQQLRATSPEMTRETAQAISGPIGLLNASLERVSGKLLTGRLPGVEKLLNQMSLTSGAKLARFGTRTGAGTILEMAQENAQDISPFLAQEVLSAIDSDIPGANLSERFGDLAENQSELFFATLPLVIIGAGVGTFRDIKGAEKLVNYDNLRSLGASEARASEIMGHARNGDEQKAQEGLREIVAKSDLSGKEAGEVAAKISQQARIERQERINLIESGEALDIIPAIRRTEEGYQLQYNDGTQGPVMSQSEANEARTQFLKDNNISLHATTRAVMAQVEKQNRNNEEIKYVFEPFEANLRDAVEESVSSEAASQNREDIGDLQTGKPTPEFDSRGRELPDQSSKFSENTLFPGTGEAVPGDFIGELEGVAGIETVPSGDKFAGTQEFFGVNKTADPELWPVVKAALDKGDIDGAKKLAWGGLTAKADGDGFRGSNPTTDEILIGLHHHRGSTGGSVVLREFTGLDSDATVNELVKAFEAKVSKGNFALDWAKARETQETEFHGARPEFRKGLSARWKKEADFLSENGNSVEPAVSSEYERSMNVANLSAYSADDRLANQIILGSNSTEYQDGIRRTVIRLHQGATPLTIVQEKVEGDADAMIRQGRREWLIGALRETEQALGQKLFLGKSDEQLTNTDIKEAYSSLAESYFVGRADQGDVGFNWQGSKFRKVAEKLMDTKLGGAITSYGEYFKAVWKRAAAVNRLRREGKLNPELETELARSVGLGDQAEFNRATLAEAQEIFDEVDRSGFTPTDDAPFSVIRREGDTSRTPKVTLNKIKNTDRRQFDILRDGKKAGELFINKNKPVVEWISVNDKGQGIANAAYDQAETIIGEKLNPSDNLSFDGFRLWQRRDPEKVANSLHHYRDSILGKAVEFGYGETKDKEGVITEVLNNTVVVSRERRNVYGTTTIRDTLKRGEIATLLANQGNPQGETSFSIIENPADEIAKMFSPFQRSPELRIKLAAEMQRRSAEMADRWRPVIAANRTKKSIEDERKDREQEIYSDLLGTLSPSEVQAMDITTGTTPLMDVIRREKMMSKTRAKKAGKNVNEYDDMPPRLLPSNAFGGDLMPDQFATMLGFDSIATMWQEIEAEKQSAKTVEDAHKAVGQRQKEFREQAKAESVEWAESAQRARETIGSDRALLIGALRTLNAMVSALPIEVRGKIGGPIKLAGMRGADAMIKEIGKRVEAIDREIEIYLKREADKGIKKLFKQVEKSQETRPGKAPKSKNDPELVALFRKLKDIKRSQAKGGWTASKGQAEADSIQAQLDAGTIAEDEVAINELAVELIPLFSGWSGATEKQTIDGREVRVKISDGAGAAQKTRALEAAKSAWLKGYADWKIKQAEIRERRDEMSLKGEANIAAESTRRKRKLRGNKKPSPADLRGPNKSEQEIFDKSRVGNVRKLNFELMSWDQINRTLLGTASDVYHFMTDGDRRASNQYTDAMMGIQDKVESLFTDIAGSRMEGRKLEYRLSQKTKDTPKLEDALGNELILSQMEMISALLMWRQEDGQRHMRGRFDEDGQLIDAGWAYDENFITAIEGEMSDEAWQVYTFLTEQYAGEYKSLNEVYKRLNGVNLPQNTFYSPLTVKPESKNDSSVDPLTGFFSGGMSGIAGSLRSRGQSVTEPDFKDALKTYVSHSMQMEHYKAYAEFSREARAVMNRRTYKNAVFRAGGETALSTLEGHLDIIDQGGVRDAGRNMAMSKLLERIGGRLAQGILFGKAFTILVNASQLGGAAVDMPAHIYARQMSRLFSRKLNWWKSLNTPYIRRRIKQMPPIVQQALEGNDRGAPNRLQDIGEKLGLGISASDGFFTAATYVMTFDYQMELGAMQGKTGPELERWARNETERIVDRVAQPTRKGARSLRELRATPESRILWNFGSESRKNFGLQSYALMKGDTQDRVGTAIFTLLFSGLFVTLGRTAWRDARDDDDDEILDAEHWHPTSIGIHFATDPLYGIPIFGQMVQDTILTATGERTFDGSILDGGKNAVPAAKRLVTLDYDLEEDYDRAISDIQKIFYAGGTFSKTSAAITGILNAAKDASQIFKNITKD